MALTTTTSVDPHILAVHIEQTIRERLVAALIMPKLMKEKNLQGARSLTWQGNKWGAIVAQGVDEDEPLVPQAAKLDSYDGSVGEVGAALEPTDLSVEVSGITPDEYAAQGVIALRQKIESDCCGLFAGVAASVGVSGEEFSLDLLNDAVTELEARDVDGVIVAVLHPYQWGAVRNQLAGKDGSTAAYFATGNVDPRLSGIPGFAGDFLGMPIFTSTHVPKVNIDTEEETADFKGCVFAADFAFEIGTMRDVRVEPERDALARSTKMAVTSVYGVTEAEGDAAIGLISAVP